MILMHFWKVFWKIKRNENNFISVDLFMLSYLKINSSIFSKEKHFIWHICLTAKNTLIINVKVYKRYQLQWIMHRKERKPKITWLTYKRKYFHRYECFCVGRGRIRKMIWFIWYSISFFLFLWLYIFIYLLIQIALQTLFRI